MITCVTLARLMMAVASLNSLVLHLSYIDLVPGLSSYNFVCSIYFMHLLSVVSWGLQGQAIWLVGQGGSPTNIIVPQRRGISSLLSEYHRSSPDLSKNCVITCIFVGFKTDTSTKSHRKCIKSLKNIRKSRRTGIWRRLVDWWDLLELIATSSALWLLGSG